MEKKAEIKNTFKKLKTSELVKVYGGRKVVNQVNVELEKGEIVGLLGPNGAGKTTTFSMIVGFVKPTEGNILLESQDGKTINITSLSMYRRARHGIVYLPQEDSIFQKLSVEDNIYAILEFRGISLRRRKRACESIMEELGIAHLAKNMAYSLSGGEKRRVEIARVLACKPLFVLLDEPFSGVDPKAVQELQEIIYKMRDRGIGILITDHSVRETLQVTNRSYLIYEGKVIRSGKAVDLVNDQKVRQIYLGDNFYMNFDEEPDNLKEENKEAL